MIEVWRPAGRHEKRPHRPRRPARPQKAAEQAPGAIGREPPPLFPPKRTAAPATSETPERKDHQQRRDRQERQERQERQQRVERQSKSFERKDNAQRRDRPPRRDKGDQVERADREQYYAKPFGGSETSATSRRIPIRLSPSSRRSSSSSSRAPKSPEAALDRQRIDKWLWHARMVRTRSDAAGLTEAGHVRLNGRRVTAPSHPVRAGDVVTLALDRAVKVIRVEGFCEKRGGRARRPGALPRFDKEFRGQGRAWRPAIPGKVICALVASWGVACGPK